MMMDFAGCEPQEDRSNLSQGVERQENSDILYFDDE
jgi:hypothetical protein